MSSIKITDADKDSSGTILDTDISFSDITTGNASTTKHGFLAKLSGVATDFLNGTGVFSDIKTYLDTLYVALTSFQTGATDNAILRANGTGGGTSQGSGITIDDSNNIVLPTTTAGATTGIIYKGATRFMHNYFGTTGIGNNLFVGLDSGNLTLNGSFGYEGTYNVAFGGDTLKSITRGYENHAFGFKALTLVTTGAGNFGLGAYSLEKVTTTNNNTATGSQSGRYTTGTGNTVNGSQSGKGTSGTSTYSGACYFGYQSGLATTTGTYNINIGYQCGNTTTTGGSNILIGKNVVASAAGAGSELNIGNVIYGTGMYGTGAIGINTGAAPNSSLQVTGSVSKSYVAKTGAYTLTATDYTVDCTSGTYAITLPTAASITGRIYNIKNSGTGVITMNTTSSQTIDGGASGTITLNQYDNLQVQSNGTNWIII